MSTISLASFSTGAAGTFITEGVSASSGQPTIATHNSVYMLVEVPNSVPVTLFPENEPTLIFSLNDYLNLIGGTVPVEGSELLSYNNVNSFFLNAQGGALYVVRVGTPAQVQRLTFRANGNKDNGTSIPSSLKKGDAVYAQISLNGQELGDKNPLGQYRGVRVVIPVDYDAGNLTSQLQISQAIRDAVKEAIEEDSLISSSAYVRDSSSNPLTGDSFLDLTGRVLGQPVVVVPTVQPVDNLFVFSLSTYDVSNLNVEDLPDQGPNDYLQTIRTGFTGQLPQGFLLAPTAFQKFRATDRAAIGAAMEALASDENYKWMALVDPGPYLVTDLQPYADFEQHSPADGFFENELYLIGNTIYRWTDSDFRFRQVNVGLTADEGINKNIDPGFDQRVSIKDDRIIDVNSANSITDVLTLAEDWPIDSDGFSTGSQVELTDSTISGLDDGTYFVIASDVEITLNGNEIKLASTIANALNNVAIEVTDVGSGVISYLNPAFDLKVTINDKTSHLLEALTNDQAFNAAYLPASLQKPTERYTFRNVVRRFVDLQGSLASEAPNFVVSSNVSTAGDTISFSNSYTDKDFVFVNKVSGATAAQYETGGLVTLGTIVGGTGYTDGTYVNIPFSGGTGGGAVADIVVSGGAVTGVTIKDGGISYVATDVLTVDDSLIGGGSSFTYTVTGASPLVNADLIGYFYVANRTGTNFQLALDPALTKVINITGAGVDSTTFRIPSVLSVSNIGADTNSLFLLEDHGLTDGQAVLFSGDVVDGNSKNFLSGTNANNLVRYYVSKVDDDTFYLAVSLAAVADSQFLNLPENPVLTTSTVEIFTDYEYESNENPFNAYNEARYIRGRKYQLDTTLAEYDLEDENADVIADRRVVIRVAQAQNAVDETGFYYTYQTQADATPISSSNLPSGDDIFFNTPTEEQDTQQVLYFVCGIEDTSGTSPPPTSVIQGSALTLNFVPEITPPSSVWNFKTVTSLDLIDEFLRGINNDGVSQVVVVDQGVDSHSKLIADGLNYSTVFGFVAYYGPYILNEQRLWVSPTPFAAGVAVRRYRAEGFQYPPAGVKYRLRGALESQIKISSAEQDVSNPLGINVLRTLPGYPTADIYIWGGRTRVDRQDVAQKLYQFVNTRVILNVIYGSLKFAFDCEIFSVGDGQNVLFTRLRALAEALLYSLWVGGALFGSKPGDAYSVICDRRNNPSNTLEEGIVQISVFVVPVPTLERIQLELVRVSIDGGIPAALGGAGFDYATSNSFI